MRHISFAALAVLVLFSLSCEAGNLYLGPDASFTVLTGLGARVLEDGSVLVPGEQLDPILSGVLPSHLDSAELHVRLTRINPLNKDRSVVVSAHEELLLARYRVGTGVNTDTDGLFADDEDDPVDTDSDTLTLPPEPRGAVPGESSEALSVAGLPVEDPPVEAGGDSPAEGSEGLPDEEAPAQALAFKAADYQLESLEDELPPFSLPETMEPGPWTISYTFMENGSAQESFSLQFLAIPVNSFVMDGLTAYPPGPESTNRPALSAGSMALFELAGRAPEGLNPVVNWYMAGEGIGKSAFGEGYSRLLHRMPEPEEQGVYNLKAEVYPFDPQAYPDFPLQPLVKTLSLAVLLEENEDSIEALEGSEVALFFTLRGDLEAKNNADIVLQPGVLGLEAQWLPLRNDFGLLAGAQAPWFLDATKSQLPSLSSKPLRFLIDAAIPDDGQLGGGSLVFDNARSLHWRLSVYGQSAMISLFVPGEADPLALVLEGVRSDRLSRIWLSLDFELASGALHVRARTHTDAEASLTIPLPEAQFQAWGPFNMGFDPLSSEVKQAVCIIHHLVWATIPSFHEEIALPPPGLDENGEQFLEI